MSLSQDAMNLVEVEFKAKEASREQWDLLHAYRRISAAERRPDDPIMPDDIVEMNMKRDTPYSENKNFYFMSDGRFVSGFGGGVEKPEAPGYENNKHLMWGGGYVIPEFRRNGIGKRWIPKAVELMEHWDRRVFTTGAELEAGHAFLRWLGAEERLSGAENRLEFEAIDWPMVEGWIEEGQKRSDDTQLLLFENRLPDDLLEEYSPVYTRMANTAPREDLDMGDFVMTPERWKESYKQADENKMSHHTMITREADGTISGLTEIWFHPARPGYINQDLTAVDPAARGRGLGKWLKAAMLDYVRKNYPDTKWVVTGNANSNGPMLAINHKLGFREYRGGSEYQISLEDLKKRVSADS